MVGRSSRAGASIIPITRMNWLAVIPAHDAAGAEFIQKAGEKLVEDLRTARLDSVYLPALGDASAVHRR
jgi:hypothetical protein